MENEMTDCPDLPLEPPVNYCKRRGCYKEVTEGYCAECQEQADEQTEREISEAVLRRCEQ